MARLTDFHRQHRASYLPPPPVVLALTLILQLILWRHILFTLP
jgi:hypothetical protein